MHRSVEAKDERECLRMRFLKISETRKGKETAALFPATRTYPFCLNPPFALQYQSHRAQCSAMCCEWMELNIRDEGRHIQESCAEMERNRVNNTVQVHLPVKSHSCDRSPHKRLGRDRPEEGAPSLTVEEKCALMLLVTVGSGIEGSNPDMLRPSRCRSKRLIRLANALCTMRMDHGASSD
jgi:hypothetical protein